MAGAAAKKESWLGTFVKSVLRDRWLYLLLLPGVVFFFVFKYIPIFGLRIAFQDYNPYDPASSPWVGFKHFIQLFIQPNFPKVLRNTVVIAVLKMVAGFPIPIILALLLNEIKNKKFVKISQTILYLPHFISWVIMAGLVMNMLDPTTGVLTNIINAIAGEEVQVLTNNNTFVPMLVISDVYKGMGWGTIIYFAALSGVDQEMYEAAAIDGARRFRQLISITLPAIMPTIIIMLILNCGNILNAGFDQIFMLYSALVYDSADIIDTFVYRTGVVRADYSFSTAAGMFKSIVAFILILIVNFAAKRSGNEGVW